MRDTSLEAYNEMQPKIGIRQYAILNAIKSLGAVTDYEITRYLGQLDPNYVRPRRKELLDMGLIVECEKRKCSVTKRTVWTWRIK